MVVPLVGMDLWWYLWWMVPRKHFFFLWNELCHSRTTWGDMYLVFVSPRAIPNTLETEHSAVTSVFPYSILIMTVQILQGFQSCNSLHQQLIGHKYRAISELKKTSG